MKNITGRPDNSREVKKREGEESDLLKLTG